MSAPHVEPWINLKNKVVLVTGASSGIGREFCLDLAKAGCRVVAAARRGDLLVSLCDQINNGCVGERSAVAVELDISADGPTIERSVQEAWDAFGRIDALVNNAGVRGKVFYATQLPTMYFPNSSSLAAAQLNSLYQPKMLTTHWFTTRRAIYDFNVVGTVKTPLDLTEEEWSLLTRTNLTGTWLVSKYVCIRMRNAKQPGSVINISSIAGLNRGQLPGGVAYAATKAAVNTLTKVMAVELGEYKIRVNSISPGLFRSEITEKLLEKDWLKTVTEKTVPLRDSGTSNPALTSLVRYLIHDSSEYVTGNTYIVDAGVSLSGIPLMSSL